MNRVVLVLVLVLVLEFPDYSSTKDEDEDEDEDEMRFMVPTHVQILEVFPPLNRGSWALDVGR